MNRDLTVLQGDTYYFQIRRRLQGQVVTLHLGAGEAGTFQLVKNGQLTAAIAITDTYVQIQSKLRALPIIGSAVDVSGGAGGPWTPIWTGDLATKKQQLMTAVYSFTNPASWVEIQYLYQDWTGWHAHCEVKAPTIDDPAVLDFTDTTAAPDSRIIIGYTGGTPDPTNGVVQVQFEAADLRGLTLADFIGGKPVYAVKMIEATGSPPREATIASGAFKLVEAVIP